MTTHEFIEILNSGETIPADSPVHLKMHELAQRALRITAEINTGYHTPEELLSLMRRLTERNVPDSFGLFPPMHTECGLNLHIGENVFINEGCEFQDQGGITIGDGTQIGPQVVIATLNHDTEPSKRRWLHPSPVTIGRNVWIGAHVTIVPGVTIGDDAVIGAGAVVTKDVPARTVTAGVPARIMHEI